MAHDVPKLFRYFSSRNYEIRIYTSALSSSIAFEEEHPFTSAVLFSSSGTL